MSCKKAERGAIENTKQRKFCQEVAQGLLKILSIQKMGFLTMSIHQDVSIVTSTVCIVFSFLFVWMGIFTLVILVLHVFWKYNTD